MMQDHKPLPDPLDDLLLAAIAVVQPAPERAGRMRERLLARVRHAPPAVAAEAQLATTRAADDGWDELLPRIFAKRVYTDGYAESYLVRLEPGCCAPAHRHPEDEECIVLSGELRIGDIVLRAGDIHVAYRGSAHGETTTESGALVYLRYAAPLAQYMPA